MEESKPKKKRKHKNAFKNRPNPGGRTHKTTLADGYNSFYRDFQKRTKENRAEVNEDGLLEVKDESGNVIAAVKDLSAGFALAKNRPEVFQKIVDKYSAGEKLIDFLGKPGFPLWQTYCNWMVKYPEFRKMMDEARVVRARIYSEQLEHVGDTVDGWNSKAGKVRADILKHLAAVHDPETFGHRTKVVGDKNQPIAFTVVTGVPESEDGETIVLPANAARAPGERDTAPLLGEGSLGSEGERDSGSALDHDALDELPVSVGGDGKSDPETPVGGG